MNSVVEVQTPELLVVHDPNSQQTLEISTVVNELLIETVESPTVIETAGAQGPAGPQGPSNQFETHLAGQVLGGNRAVVLNTQGKLVYSDISSEDSFVVGITTSSAVENELTQIQIAGTMTEPSWNWIPGKPIYVSVLGVLTQTAATTNQLITVGIAYKPTSIFINLHPTIYRG